MPARRKVDRPDRDAPDGIAAFWGCVPSCVRCPTLHRRVRARRARLADPFQDWARVKKPPSTPIFGWTAFGLTTNPENFQENQNRHDLSSDPIQKQTTHQRWDDSYGCGKD